MRRTKIVCTIGPASDSVEVMAELIRAGMDVARFNLSHGHYPEHAPRIERLREAMRLTGQDIAVMLDTEGPEIRTGLFTGGQAYLEAGRFFTLTTEPVEGDESRAFVDHPLLARDVRPGATVLLDDGNIVLEVLEVEETEVRCRVVHGGVLRDRKKVNLPGVKVSLPSLSEKDVADLRFAARIGADYVAASFVRSADDVLAVRKVLEDHDGEALIIAKIESREGVQNLGDILKVCDGIMVARGDLGVEYPAEEVPLIQKEVISRCNRLGKPVITATQMLESMVEKPRPTRAEASDVANAILDGTDAVMLSAETAAGRFPVEACRMMARIAERTEQALPYQELLARRVEVHYRTVTEAISHATCTIAADLGAAAIVTATQSGHTARMVSKYRPRAPLIAVKKKKKVARRLRLVWGVSPIQSPFLANTDETIHRAVQVALEAGAIGRGDLVVITAGAPAGVPGTTNLVQVQTVGEVLVRGTGIGAMSATGPVCVARGLKEAIRKFRPGDILVTVATDKEFVPLMQRAAGVVTEAGGLTSHAAVVGLNLGLPVIVGAEGATGVLQDGMRVTIDGSRGLVYSGNARVL